MKNALVMSLLLLSFSLMANETFLPEKLLCSSEAKIMDLQQFTLEKINSGKPFLTSQLIWESTEFNGPDLAFSFIDSDDQSISLKFTKIDLYQLKIGAVPSISGELTSTLQEEITPITCSEVK